MESTEFEAHPPKRSHRVKDLASQVFGKLTVREWAGSNARGKSLWRCICECGAEAVLPSDDLRSGNTRSCGCGQSKPSTRQDLHDAFEDRVIRASANDCWGWSGSYMTNGYTRITRRRNGSTVTVLGHRLSYEMFVGPIPDGLVIDHLCRNRGCTNPKHLEAVTNEENIARGEWVPGRKYREGHHNV